MRDSPMACATLGLDLTRTKVAVFSLSAALAGLAGALYGGLRTSAGDIEFQMFFSLPLLLMAVIGGITTVSGALVGGLLYGALLPVVQERYQDFAGLVYLVVGLGAVSLGRNPDGLAAVGAQVLRRLLRPSAPRPTVSPTEPDLIPETPEVTRVAAPAG
jgi:branched-chain amino acid transport system permease protein